jgi:hypothetical protein
VKARNGCYGHSNFQRGDYNRCMMVSSSNNQHTTPALFPSARVANNTIVASNRTSSSSTIAEGGFSTFSSSSSFEDVMGSIAPIHIARLTNNTAHQQQDYNSSALPFSYSSFRGRNINGDSSHLLGPMIGLSGARRRSHQYVNEQPFSERKLVAYEEAKRLFQQHQHERRTQHHHALEACISLRRGTTSGTGTQHFNSDHNEDESSRILREALLVLERDRTLSRPRAPPPPGLYFS